MKTNTDPMRVSEHEFPNWVPVIYVPWTLGTYRVPYKHWIIVVKVYLYNFGNDRFERVGNVMGVERADGIEPTVAELLGTEAPKVSREVARERVTKQNGNVLIHLDQSTLTSKGLLLVDELSGPKAKPTGKVYRGSVESHRIHLLNGIITFEVVNCERFPPDEIWHIEATCPGVEDLLGRKYKIIIGQPSDAQRDCQEMSRKNYGNHACWLCVKPEPCVQPDP